VARVQKLFAIKIPAKSQQSAVERKEFLAAADCGVAA
jgi:hypothetical protein